MSETSSKPPSRVSAASIAKAKEFYAADSQLSTEQRKTLAGAFIRQGYFYPIITLPIVFGLIAAPRKFAPKNKVRVYQIILGLSGVFLGQEAAEAVGYRYNLSSLSSDSTVQQCYKVLGRASPQIGYRYYQNTAKHPELAMPDPETIDWSQQMSFPLNLIFARKPQPGQRQPQHLYERPERKAEQWRLDYEAKAKGLQSPELRQPGDTYGNVEGASSASGSASGPTSASGSASSGTGSSWDKIRAQSSASGAPGSSPGSVPGSAPSGSPFGAPPPPQPTATPDKQASFDNMIDRARGGSYNVDLSEEQRKFDALLERERSGHGADDFAASESKWS